MAKIVTKKKVAAKAASPTAAEPDSTLSAAQAAALVERTLPTMRGGHTDASKTVPVTADEVLDFTDYGDHVVVVTQDGKKLRGDK